MRDFAQRLHRIGLCPALAVGICVAIAGGLSSSALAQAKEPSFPSVIKPEGTGSQRGNLSGANGHEENVRKLPKGEQLVRDFEAMELAIKAYDKVLPTKTYVFGSDHQRKLLKPSSGHEHSLIKSTRQMILDQYAHRPVYDWQVLESSAPVAVGCKLAGEVTTPDVSAEAWQGFSATTYVNHTSKQIVVAIAGTDILSLSDLNNDRLALMHSKPPHFDAACAYFQDVIKRYEAKFDQYEFSCTGHSLGGGACSYAAAMLGRPAVTLNPIGNKWQPVGSNAPRAAIRHYIDPDDLAYNVFKTIQLPPVGTIYWIKAPPKESTFFDGLLQIYRIFKPETTLQRFSKAHQSHSASNALDRLGNIAKIQRLQ